MQFGTDEDVVLALPVRELKTHKMKNLDIIRIWTRCACIINKMFTGKTKMCERSEYDISRS